MVNFIHSIHFHACFSSRSFPQTVKLLYFVQTGHLVTNSANCWLITGHHTAELALSRHLEIPWYPSWMFFTNKT